MGVEGGLSKGGSKIHNGGGSIMRLAYAKLFRVIVVMALIAAVAIVTVALSVRFIATSKSSSLYFVELPLYFDRVHKKYFLMVRVEDKSGWMLLDTGSSITLLDEAQFGHDSSGQSPLSTERVFMPFTNTDIVVKKVRIRRLIIGSWTGRSLIVGVASRSVIGIPTRIQGYPVLGLLGYDVISLWPFVRVSKARLVFTNRHLTVPSGTEKTLRLVPESPILCVREAGDKDKRIWVIDTGVESHYAEDSSLSGSSEYRSPSALFTARWLSALGNKSLWLPAVATAKHAPPLMWKGLGSVAGIIGNGILNRYEVFINHRDKQVSFVESALPNQHGTFGLLLFTEPRRNKTLVYFTVPQGTFRGSNSLVKLISVNGRHISGMSSEVENLLQKPQVGTSVHLTVRDSSGREFAINCLAFSPDEVGANFYKGSLRVGDFKYTFTILEQRYRKIWLYPYQWKWGEREKGMKVIPRASLATSQTGISVSLPSREPLREVEPVNADFTMEIHPLH